MQRNYFPEHLIFFPQKQVLFEEATATEILKILQKGIKWERLHLPLLNI